MAYDKFILETITGVNVISYDVRYNGKVDISPSTIPWLLSNGVPIFFIVIKNTIITKTSQMEIMHSTRIISTIVCRHLRTSCPVWKLRVRIYIQRRRLHQQDWLKWQGLTRTSHGHGVGDICIVHFTWNNQLWTYVNFYSLHFKSSLRPIDNNWLPVSLVLIGIAQ